MGFGDQGIKIFLAYSRWLLGIFDILLHSGIRKSYESTTLVSRLAVSIFLALQSSLCGSHPASVFQFKRSHSVTMTRHYLIGNKHFSKWEKYIIQKNCVASRFSRGSCSSSEVDSQSWSSQGFYFQAGTGSESSLALKRAIDLPRFCMWFSSN